MVWSQSFQSIASMWSLVIRIFRICSGVPVNAYQQSGTGNISKEYHGFATGSRKDRKGQDREQVELHRGTWFLSSRSRRRP